MSGSVTSHRALPRLSRRRSVLGVRVSQFIAWQVVAVVVAIALSKRGPVSWALSGVALAGCVLTMLRWRHRWAYEWLASAWTHRGEGSRLTLPFIDVCPTRLRSGAEAGVAHDGSGFAVIVAIAAQPSGPPVIELPVVALAGLLDPQDAMVSAVQLVLHAELAAVGPSVLATAYRNLGYSHVPRSQSAWLALRHDPALSRPPARDVLAAELACGRHRRRSARAERGACPVSHHIRARDSRCGRANRPDRDRHGDDRRGRRSSTSTVSLLPCR